MVSNEDSTIFITHKKRFYMVVEAAILEKESCYLVVAREVFFHPKTMHLKKRRSQDMY